MNNIKNLYQKFESIQKMGWVKSYRKGDTGIGKTFEELLGKTEENFEYPDFEGIEIKTKRYYSQTYTCLFSATPDGTYIFETKRLVENYGYPDKVLTDKKRLNDAVFATEKTNVGYDYLFQLKVNRRDRRLYLYIYDVFGRLLDTKTYWEFSTLQEKLYRKLQLLAIVTAKRQIQNNWEYFKYEKIEFYRLMNFNRFIFLIEKGIIRVNFKIGVFRSGSRKGEIHDHGTGFEIKKQDLEKLYCKIPECEYKEDKNQLIK